MDIYMKDAHLNGIEKLIISENFKTIDENVEALNHNVNALANAVSKLIQLLKDEIERHKWTVKLLYEICPDLEVIETMAENDDDRERMIKLHMNVDEDYYEKYLTESEKKDE